MKRICNPALVLGMVFSGVLFGGCQIATHDEAVTGITGSERAQSLVQEAWSQGGQSGPVDDGWLKGFQDPQLMRLVEEAQENNFGLKISRAEVDRANALARKAGADLKPSLGLSGHYADGLPGGRGDYFGGNLRVSWEADVWGRVRSGAAAEEEKAAASVSDYAYARQSLAASVSNGWFLAVGSKMLHDDASAVVALYTETLRIAEVKESVGKGAMADVHMARASLASARDAERKTFLAMENAKRSLEVILGRYPSAEIETAAALVAVLPPVATGIPSGILERRPDLVAAEQRVAAAFYKEASAELLHLPQFNFSLGAGLSNLSNASTSLAAGIFAPLYTGGVIEAEIDSASAEQQQAIAAYGQKALEALSEVERSLSSEAQLMERQRYLTAVVEENEKAYLLTRKVYEVGKAELLDVLVVQERWVQAQIALTHVSVERLVNRVGFHLALGGSFDESPQGASVPVVSSSE